MPPKTTETPPPSLELFCQHMRDTIRKIGDGFTKPDDDWLIGVLHLENVRHEHEIYGLAGDMFNSEAGKDAIALHLCVLLKDREAIRYGLMLNTWGVPLDVSADDEDAEERVMALHEEWAGGYGSHPNATEQLVIEAADLEGQESWTAIINRHPDRPPTLSEWVMHTAETEGRFSVLRDALRLEVEES